MRLWRILARNFNTVHFQDLTVNTVLAVRSPSVLTEFIEGDFLKL